MLELILAHFTQDVGGRCYQGKRLFGLQQFSEKIELGDKFTKYLLTDLTSTKSNPSTKKAITLESICKVFLLKCEFSCLPLVDQAMVIYRAVM